MPILDGVDTSNNQGPGVVNLGPELKAADCEGWWHKATEGSSRQVTYGGGQRGGRDGYWPAVREKNRDFRYRGPYHWLTPGSPVADQFGNFVDYVGDLQEGECIQLDIEDPAGLSDAKVFEAVDRWSERYAGRILVYTGRWYMPYKPNPGGPAESYLIDRLMARYGEDLKWWLPWYDNKYPGNRIPMTPVMWQWAGGGAGLSTSVGRIDSNEIILRDQLEKLCGYIDKVNPNPPPTEGETMSSFMGCVTLTPSGGAGAVMFGSDGQYYRYDYHPGSIYYAFPKGTMADNEYAAMPIWDPAADARWVAQFAPTGGGSISPDQVNQIAQAVRDKLRTDPLK